LNSLQNSAFFNNAGFGVLTNSTTDTLIHNSFSFNNGKGGFSFASDTRLKLNNVSISNTDMAVVNDSDARYFGNFITSDVKMLNGGKVELIAGKDDPVFSNAVDLNTPTMSPDYLINAFDGSQYLTNTSNSVDMWIGNNLSFVTTSKALYTYGTDLQDQTSLYYFDEADKTYKIFGTDSLNTEFDSTKPIAYTNPYIPLLWDKFLNEEFWATENLTNADIIYAVF